MSAADAQSIVMSSDIVFVASFKNKDPPPTLNLSGQQIQRVTSFKLLGTTVTDTLSWEENTSIICSKAAKRLHFLKLLKRSGMPANDLEYYYSTVIRPVLEYSSVLWKTSLTVEQTHRLDMIEKRAERIVGLDENCRHFQNDETYSRDVFLIPSCSPRIVCIISFHQCVTQIS